MEQPATMTLELLEAENFLSHIRENSYTCVICGDSFKHKGILAAHQKSHKEEIEAEGCEEGDVDQAGELHHQEAIRAGEEANVGGHSKHSTQSDPERREKPRACTECGKSFKMKVDLTKQPSCRLMEQCGVCYCGKIAARNKGGCHGQRTQGWGPR